MAIELEWIKQLQRAIGTPSLDRFFIAIDRVDSVIFLIALVLFLWLWKGRQLGIRLLVIFFLNRILNAGLKALFNHPRPCQIDPSVAIYCLDSPGFPSGHAQFSFLIAGILFVETKNRWLRAFGVAFCLLISFSRVYLGLHFPTQILAGWVSGFLLVLIYWKLFPRWGL